jgi:hypothetical protein
MGYTQGNDGENITHLLGLKTTTGHSIVIETSNNIRLSGIGAGNKANAIYLTSKELHVTAEAKD